MKNLIQSLATSYKQLKREYLTACLFFKESNLCTILNGDAWEAANILGLPITYSEGIPYVQFPAENIDFHISQLLKKGIRIAIVEPLK